MNVVKDPPYHSESQLMPYWIFHIIQADEVMTTDIAGGHD